MKTLNSALWLLFLSTNLFIASTSYAQSWQSLGSKTVTRQAEVDRIDVSERGLFRQLKLSAQGTGIKVHRMRITFRNGDQKEISMNSFVFKDSQSRLIDLPGKARAIKHIRFYYDAKGLGRKMAVLTIWGKR